MAYSTGTTVNRQYYVDREHAPEYRSASVGTQGDKTIGAMTVPDSLIRHLPLSEHCFEMSVKDVRSDLVTSYPSFRSFSRRIASGRRTDGETVDSRIADYMVSDQMSLADNEHCWNSQVASAPMSGPVPAIRIRLEWMTWRSSARSLS